MFTVEYFVHKVTILVGFSVEDVMLEISGKNIWICVIMQLFLVTNSSIFFLKNL